MVSNPTPINSLNKTGKRMTDDRDMHDRGPTNYAISTEVKVLTERVANLTQQVKERSDNTDRKLDNVLQNFATKVELNEVSADVKNLRAALWWAVKIVLGAVIVGLVSLVISKNGIPHT